VALDPESEMRCLVSRLVHISEKQTQTTTEHYCCEPLIFALACVSVAPDFSPCSAESPWATGKFRCLMGSRMHVKA
jgi:hypothetical protein